MRVTPLALRLERFKSYRKPVTFDFPREPGLYFMLGRNEAEPRMTGNATGKSTLWDALTWLMHDRTPGGLKAGDVCNWDEEKGVEVSLEFRLGDGLPQFIRRTWKPNAWVLQDLFGKDVDLGKDPQNPVLAALRVGLDAWLRSVVLAQGERTFLDLKRDEQAALFSTVMDLDAWDERAERASRAASEEDRRCRELESRLARARGALDAIDGQDHAEAARRWEEARRRRLDDLTADHERTVALRKGLRRALEAAQGREAEAREGLAAARPDAALEDERDGTARELRRIEDEITSLAARLDEAEVAMRAGERDSNCPACGRPLETHDWQRHAAAAERKVRGLDAEIKQRREAAKPVRNRVHVLDGRLREQEAGVRKAGAAVEDAERATSRARNDLAHCDRDLDRMEEEYDRAEREENPHEAAAGRVQVQASNLRLEVAELGAELADRERARSVKQFWVRGFREIRLREIAGALSELEVEVNSCVTELGLVDWELEFRVDRETKGGKVQRGFDCLVRAPGAGGRAVPWAAWSGGEKQRLRVAADMGLGNLVRARTGCDFPLEVWDEPTNGLSPEGKRDLFEALASRARREGRLVFLVDHQAHDFGGFAGTATVVKTPGGSRLRTTW